jgi:hypothetical protein
VVQPGRGLGAELDPDPRAATRARGRADGGQLHGAGVGVDSREAYIDSGDAFAYTAWKPISPIRVRVHGDSAVIRYKSEIELHGTRGHLLAHRPGRETQRRVEDRLIPDDGRTLTHSCTARGAPPSPRR